MEENKRDEEYGSDIKIKLPISKKLENFWYHYKWHTIAAVFIIVAIVVCSLQMCSRESVDFHIMYAGGAEISKTSEDGDTPEYVRIIRVLENYVDDVDGDGKKNIAFSTYFAPSDEEIKIAETTPGVEVNYNLMSSDRDALNARFGNGDYYLCFISPHVYEQYKGVGDVSAFAPIANYAPMGAKLEYYSEYAIKLSSTSFYKNNPDIREILPEDTLVAIQIKRVIGVKKDNDERYSQSVKVLQRILSE